MDFLQLIRPKNLLIVAITQLFFQFIIIQPAFIISGVPLELSPINLALLIICTLFITAGGNVINDIFDFEIDQHNKTNIPINQLGKKTTWTIYWAIVFLGAAIAFYVAFSISNLWLFGIYPLAVFLLFLYSYKLKHQPIIGNVVVSLFTALVIFILLFAERKGISNIFAKNELGAHILFTVSLGFMSFAFLANFIREIIKDIEDIDGDKKGNSQTLPLRFGIQIAKNTALLLSLLLIVLLIIWPLVDNNPYATIPNRLYLGVILISPLIYIIVCIKNASKKEDYHRISQLLKLYMIVGLLYLPFYYLT